jgi:hypothetical protein
MARKRSHTPEKEGDDGAAKMPKHAEINQHLQAMVADSEACYVHPRIPIPTPLVLAEVELSDQEGANLMDSMHISDGFETEGSDVEPLIRRTKASLSPSPLIVGSFFFTPPL